MICFVTFICLFVCVFYDGVDVCIYIVCFVIFCIVVIILCVGVCLWFAKLC